MCSECQWKLIRPLFLHTKGSTLGGSQSMDLIYERPFSRYKYLIAKLNFSYSRKVKVQNLESCVRNVRNKLILTLGISSYSSFHFVQSNAIILIILITVFVLFYYISKNNFSYFNIKFVNLIFRVILEYIYGFKLKGPI